MRESSGADWEGNVYDGLGGYSESVVGGGVPDNCGCRDIFVFSKSEKISAWKKKKTYFNTFLPCISNWFYPVTNILCKCFIMTNI